MGSHMPLRITVAMDREVSCRHAIARGAVLKKETCQKACVRKEFRRDRGRGL